MKKTRILLKLSGEALSGPSKFGIDSTLCSEMAKAIAELQKQNLEVAVVIGGGNIFRGVNLKELGMERTPADHIGMLSTLINGIALQQALHSLHCPATVMSALECPKVADPYNWQKAQKALESNQILIFVGGTGNPYFTTDTAAALRASEIGADLLIKATKVDGIYNKDPLKYPDAKKYQTISYTQFLAEKLAVIDATAIAMCMNNKIPVLVINMKLLGTGQSSQILAGAYGTIVKE